MTTKLQTIKRKDESARVALFSCSFQVAVWVIVFIELLGFRSIAQTGPQHEPVDARAKALFHIIEYVEWPKESHTNNTSAIAIGLLGQIPFADSLQGLTGQTNQGRELIVKNIPELKAASGCQVLFIGTSEKARLPEILQEVKDRPVLTVSEVEHFTEQGGMINMVTTPSRVNLKINGKAAKDAKLNVSSQLLKLSKVPR